MSLEDVPSWLADNLEINLGTAKILISIPLLFTVLLPLIYLTKESKANLTLVYIGVVFLVEMFLVGLGWLDFWILIATIALMAFGVAVTTSGGLTGEN